MKFVEIQEGKTINASQICEFEKSEIGTSVTYANGISKNYVMTYEYFRDLMKFVAEKESKSLDVLAKMSTRPVP